MDHSMDAQPHSVFRKLKAANEKAWLLLGSIAEVNNDIDNTIAAYDNVLTQNPNNVHALLQLGIAYENSAEFAKALEYFQHVVQIDNTSGDGWGHLAYCFLMQNELHCSYTAYQHALYHTLTPKDPKMWFGIGLLYERYGSFDQAEEAYDAVLKMQAPNDLMQEVQFRVAVVTKHRGHYEAALENLRVLLDQGTSPALAGDIWQQIGHVYELKNEMHHAKNSYLKMLEHSQHNSKVYQHLGWLAMNMKPHSENAIAIEYLKKAVAEDKTDGGAWYILGRCYMSLNNSEDAYHAYKEAVNFDGSNPNVWCSLGILFFRLSQHLDALDAYSRAINLNANICEVWYNVGTLYDACNQINDAKDAYEKAGELGADGVFIRERLENLEAKKASGTAGTLPGPSEPPIQPPLNDGGPPQQMGNQYGNAPAPITPSPATANNIPAQHAPEHANQANVSMNPMRSRGMPHITQPNMQPPQGMLPMSNRGHPIQPPIMGQMHPAHRNMPQQQRGAAGQGQQNVRSMQPGQMQPVQMQPGLMQPGQMQPGQMQPGQVHGNPMQGNPMQQLGQRPQVSPMQPSAMQQSAHPMNQQQLSSSSGLSRMMSSNLGGMAASRKHHMPSTERGSERYKEPTGTRLAGLDQKSLDRVPNIGRASMPSMADSNSQNNYSNHRQ